MTNQQRRIWAQMFPIPEFLDYQAQNHVFDRSIGVYQDTF